MREPLLPYTGADKLNFLCLVASELLHETSLVRMPALLTGFESIHTALPSPAAQALRNLRLARCAPATLRELTLMADAYCTHHRGLQELQRTGKAPAGALPQRFVVGENLSIRKTWTKLVPADVFQAMQALTNVLPIRARSRLPMQDPRTSAEISHSADYSAYIEALGFEPPAPPTYEVARLGKAPGRVHWADLVAVADSFDACDVAQDRQAQGERTWYRRLHDAAGDRTAVLQRTSVAGLEPTDVLDLTGLKHLIGLPGSGKTTLLYLLAGHLAAREHAVCFLFPSIEVATGFIETLAQYGVDVGLLSGQGETSRNRHVLNFATALATTNMGLGVTRSVARTFATNCALAGFASDEESEFPHGNPPCMRVQQKPPGKSRSRAHQCALSSVCGYQHGERSLSAARLWAGHVLSMDRAVSRLYVESEIRHFEYIARTFDLVVIDECDGAQSAMDAQGTPTMKVYGDDDSLCNTLLREIHMPAAAGRNAFVAGEAFPSLMEMTGRFGRAADRLVGRISHLPKKFRERNARLLLTSLSVIADMFAEPGETEEDPRRSIRQGLERLWDDAAKRVAFRYSSAPADAGEEGPSDLERTLQEAHGLMGTPIEELRGFHSRLVEALEAWERFGNDDAVKEVAAVLRGVPGLPSSLDDETFFASCALLVAVSMLVLQQFGLAPHLRLLNSEGLLSDNVFESRPSRDQKGMLPESLVGRLSGVRYTISEEGNVDVTHVSFAGTPRTLPERMLGLSGEREGSSLAVLLTSATSMLEQSPSFHVACGPHYVLQRPNAGEGWRRSRYRFLPQSDPRDRRPLRFSGAKMAERDAILTIMVDELLRGGEVSEVACALRDNDCVDGVQRNAAFVVNSYEQCRLLYDHIIASHPSWRGRVRYLARASTNVALGDNAVTAAEVESLGSDRHWSLLIFPMNAIGRGVNIVFQCGSRANKAMIGSLFFLTRPHPRGDSLQLIQGLVGRASQRFDRLRFTGPDVALQALRDQRQQTNRMVEHLLRMPLVAQTLGEFSEPFVADQMIIILQTIGRAMRGDCPAFVYFVDAAWAPSSARGERDTPRTSMLVMMQSILRSCLRHPDASARACYQQLYQSFDEPMSAIEGLIV